MCGLQSSSIRLLLVEEDRSVRRALRMSLELEPDLTVAGEAGDRRAALDLAEHLQPDVIIAEMPVSGRQSLRMTAELLQACPSSAVLILSHFDDVARRREAAALGAGAFIGKHEPYEALLAAIRRLSSADPSSAPGGCRSGR